ncbi:MAG: 50S ribosomal protein L3 [Bacilli bacterium]|nr:50S ribosomal protein L3 [Bacilli bacterium]MDD4076456.1 50S ribosomal protein L3 [Bacilli bacterium]MDD4387985.1 50S ribosomal protein L3 [Bacilli bacterium]
MAKGILGKKIGMTQIFKEDGLLVPVTVIDVKPNIVLQKKTIENDGYTAIQLGYEDKPERLANKPETGHVAKANTNPKRFVKEIVGTEMNDLTIGQEVKANIFKEGEIVDVTGTSKGKGYQGVIKRYNFHRGPMSHGSKYHRGIGSLGSVDPARIKKGKKMPGRMGGEQVTVQNLEVVKIDIERNVMLIKGNVPGPRNSYVVITNGIKAKNPAVNPDALI